MIVTMNYHLSINPFNNGTFDLKKKYTEVSQIINIWKLTAKKGKNVQKRLKSMEDLKVIYKKKKN